MMMIATSSTSQNSSKQKTSARRGGRFSPLSPACGKSQSAIKIALLTLWIIEEAVT
jgi:hypothetical protein